MGRGRRVGDGGFQTGARRCLPCREIMGWTRNARDFSKQFLTVTEPGGEPRLAATRENGQVQLTLTGRQGSRYAIETSTALPNWNSADLTVTVTNQSSAVAFPAPDAPNASTARCGSERVAGAAISSAWKEGGPRENANDEVRWSKCSQFGIRNSSFAFAIG